MRTKSRFILVAAMLAASVAIPAVGAFACEEAARQAARREAAKREAAKREADASLVADWLAQRILQDLAQGDADVVDISADEVRRATGVDATNLDLERLREQVAAKMLAVGPYDARSVVPAPPAPPAVKAVPATKAKATPKAAPAHKTAKAAPAGRTAKATKDASHSGSGSAARRATEESSCGKTLLRH